MRRFDKKINILQANILSEQTLIKKSGYLRELDESVYVPSFDFDDVGNNPYIKEKETRMKSGYKVRFNLGKTSDKDTGKSIFMTWKIETSDNTEYLSEYNLNYNPYDLVDVVSSGGVRNNFNPNEFNMEFTNCSLVNRPNSGYKIKCHSDKFIFAYLKCEDIKVNYGRGVEGPPESRIMYNPRITPYWVMIGSTELFETATNKPIKIGDTDMEIKNYEDGLVYESCLSRNRGIDDILPVTKYYYIQNNGESYVKVVESHVDDYKSIGRIYKIVDKLKFTNAYTCGNKIFLS